MTMYDDNRVVTLLREIDPPLAPPDRLSAVTRRARRGESRRASALAGVMALVLVVGVVSAMKLGDRGATQTLTVAGAADATAAAHTARVTMDMTLTGPDVAVLEPGGHYVLSGPVDFEHERYSLKGRIAGTDFELRGIGKEQWTTQVGGLGLVAGGLNGKKWLHLTDDSKNGGGISQLDPSKLLGVLTRRGHELSRKAVDGRTVFVLKVPADVLDSTAETGAADDVVTVDVDGEDRIRTLTTAPKTGSSDGTMSLKISYDDFGIDVDVRPPPKDQVAEMDDITEQFGRSGSSGDVQTFGGQLGSSAEACAALAKQRDELLARVPEGKRAEVTKIFDQSLAACAKKD